MASRGVLRTQTILNDGENQLKNVKSMAAPPERVAGRKALKDLGNKVTSQTVGKEKNVLNKTTLKKSETTIMGPPKGLTKKVVDKNSTFLLTNKKILNETNQSTTLSKSNTSLSMNNTTSSLSQHTLKREESLVMPKISSYSTNQINIYDPDEKTKNEPLQVTEYLPDIFSYLREVESQIEIKKGFLNNHQTTQKMRSILVNWLVEVHSNFKLSLESLYLGVTITDRYLQENKTVDRASLQLVGVSALLIACKYEELYLPEVSDFVYVCDDSFSHREILSMEIEILKKLDFNLGRPLPIHFLRRYNKIAQVLGKHHDLGKYIIELALVEYSCAHIKPSIQAAAACCLAKAVLNDVMDPSKIWTPTLVHYTTYKYADFKEVLIKFAHMLTNAETSKYQAIREKYSSAKFGKISLTWKLKGYVIRKLTEEPLKI